MTSGDCELPPGILRDAVNRLKDIPTDGAVAEGPHARGMRVGQASRAARWYWIASTMRLTPNINDARPIIDRVGCGNQQLGNTRHSVLRMKVAKGQKHRTLMMTTQTAHNKINEVMSVPELDEQLDVIVEPSHGDVDPMGGCLGGAT